MTTRELCERYLGALNAGNVAQVLALFDQDAMVLSPLYGRMPAGRFYADLFADTGRSETRFVNLFESPSGQVALQFHYRWTLSTGRVVEFDCVDVFELNADRSLFAGLTIIYDTAPLRADFEAARSA
ncbi:MAG TPA: nuclear transport factor 2 family protein [Noviherbaspirillum sp.]|uniref:nuclear transport factor 2 family protein n=1 Tax=Noviherbaspirillum sp. TaxID=1926288 RepID=UPI002D33B914|nr:nuclear transport factor 2 family protein [Noviherbaspirillum sp.]HYD95187.1 nuclear transport factor 2 family protein [Noviherbaspirillum sp.]